MNLKLPNNGSGNHWLLPCAIALLLLESCGSTPPGHDLGFSFADSTPTQESVVKYSVADMQRFLAQAICPNLAINSASCLKNTSEIASNSSFGNFKLQQISNSVTAYRLIYRAPDMVGRPRKLSGAIIVPDIPANKIKGVVLYYHATNENKKTVPSNFDPRFGKFYSLSLASIFAADGYVVVAPDYIGLGVDGEVLHPYTLYPQLNANSGIYMLEPALKFLATHGAISQQQPLKLYISGYSEGGAYALWAAHLLEGEQQQLLVNSGLKLTKTAPASGAYDLADAQLDFEFANVASDESQNKYHVQDTTQAFFSKPILISYAVSAYATYGLAGKPTDIAAIFAPNFYTFSSAPGGVQLPANIYELLTKSARSDAFSDYFISEILAKHAAAQLNPETKQTYSPTNNSINALVNPALYRDQKFKQALTAASIGRDWSTNSPVKILFLRQDSLVYNLSSEEAFTILQHNSRLGLVSRFELDNRRFLKADQFYANQLRPIDHMEAMPALLLVALNYFNQD